MVNKEKLSNLFEMKQILTKNRETSKTSQNTQVNRLTMDQSISSNETTDDRSNKRIVTKEELGLKCFRCNNFENKFFE